MCVFLQGVSASCKPCTSYDLDVRPSVRLSVCHTLALCENEADYDHEIFTDG